MRWTRRYIFPTALNPKNTWSQALLLQLERKMEAGNTRANDGDIVHVVPLRDNRVRCPETEQFPCRSPGCVVAYYGTR